MMKKILIVDDEQNVLDGLSRMLFPMRKQLTILTANNGVEALKVLAEEDISIILSDMRMPQMDGYELLAKARESYPGVFRILLTGQSDRDKIVSSLALTHKYLHKPCNSNELINSITKLLSLEKYIKDPGLQRIFNNSGDIPLLPDVYWKLEKELSEDEVSSHKIAHLISTDPIIAAKILQYVNSTLFGLQVKILDLTQAVNFLGLELIKTLILYVKLFSYLKVEPETLEFLFKIASKSIIIAETAKSILQKNNIPKAVVDEAYITALIKDIGVFFLAQFKEYEEIIDKLKTEQEPLSIAEMEHQIFNTNHCHVGAYLLGLWDFPESIISIVENHHGFVKNAYNLTKPQAAVYFADAIYYNNNDIIEWFKREAPEDVKNWEKTIRGLNGTEDITR
jgi:HD-like signal output (HDOD) protein/CheY-like chemotaxis protein